MRHFRRDTLLMVVMMGVISGFLSYVFAAYNFAASEDMLYSRFLSSHRKTVTVQLRDGLFAQEGEGELDLTLFGTDYTVRKTLQSSFKKSEDGVQGIYSAGEVYIPPLLSGRYFTQEELDGGAPVAVVGKSILEKLTPDGEGERYYDLNGTLYRVIGCMGKRYETTLDNVVFLPMPTVCGTLTGSYFVDSKSEEVSRDVTDRFLAVFALNPTYSGTLTATYTPTETQGLYLGDTNGILFLLAAVLILLNTVLICARYADRSRRSMAIRKLVGVGAVRAVSEVLFRFFLIATAGYGLGLTLFTPILYSVMNRVSENVCLQLTWGNFLLSYGATVGFFALITVPLSVRLYMTDTAEILKEH